MLSSRLLAQFIAVAEELHFGRAAARLYMAQSPLSHAIRRLEAAIGAPLFVRTKRSVSLTTAGEVLLQQAKALTNAEHAAIASVRRAHRYGSGRLAVGFVGTVAYGVVPRLLRNFRRANPEIELSISEMTTRDQTRNLLSGQLDAGIVRLPYEPGAALSRRVIERDAFALALPVGHPRAARRRVVLADFASEPFVAYSHDRVPLLHAQGTACCLDAGFYPNIVCEAWQASSILSFVAAGIGLALVPSHLAVMKHEGVVFRRLTDAGPHAALQIVAVWRANDTSPALARFLASLPVLAPN